MHGWGIFFPAPVRPRRITFCPGPQYFHTQVLIKNDLGIAINMVVINVL